MEVARTNSFGRLCRVQIYGDARPRFFREAPSRVEQAEMVNYLSGISLGQGSQILRVPVNSRIENMSLSGGASWESPFAVLRGGVLKFDEKRMGSPIVMDGHGFKVPTGFTLMDERSFSFTRDVRNSGADIPFELIRGKAAENLYLVEASYCHPDQLFLRLGSILRSEFYTTGSEYPHLYVDGQTLFLSESELPTLDENNGSYDIFSRLGIDRTGISFIQILLRESGYVHMSLRG